MHDCTLKLRCAITLPAVIAPAGYVNSLPLRDMHPLAPWRYANTFPLLIMQHLGTCCKFCLQVYTACAHYARYGRCSCNFLLGNTRHFSLVLINCLSAFKMTKYYTEQLIFKSKTQNSPSMFKNIHYLTKFLLFNVKSTF